MTTYRSTDPNGQVHTFTTKRVIGYVAWLHMSDDTYAPIWRKSLDGAKRELSGRVQSCYGNKHTFGRAVIA